MKPPHPRIFAGFSPLAVAWLLMPGTALAGDYSKASNDPSNPHDAPIPGFTGGNGIGLPTWERFDTQGEIEVVNPLNYLNPLFFAWGGDVTHYVPSESVVSQVGVGGETVDFGVTSAVIGPVTGDNFDVVSLGDMTATQIANGADPGTITIELARPLKNLSGADFVVFENGQIATEEVDKDQNGVGIGGVFAELAYVEVSGDGTNFVRFPSISQNTTSLTAYASMDGSKVFNLAGKHVNNQGSGSWGTPFDLSTLPNAPEEITHIRIVDIPGNGAFKDSLGNSIYDPWKTFGSGGFDLEAIGAISSPMTFDDWPQLAEIDKRFPGQTGENEDPDQDGVPNLLEYAFATLPWQADTATSATRLERVAGTLQLHFRRDERLADLTYEVQASDTLAGPWTPVARLANGGTWDTLGYAEISIQEASADTIQSVGVVRQVTLSAPLTSDRRFFRVKVSR